MDSLIHHMLESSVRRFPDKEALVSGVERLTYKDVQQRVSALARALRSAGVKRGDRVGILLEPSVPQVISIFAVSRASAVYVPIHALLFPQQVVHIVRDCGMPVLITSRSKLAALAPALAEIGSPQLNILVVVEDGPAKEDDGHAVSYLSYDELCSSASSDCLPDPGVDRDLAAILYTSGSTGKPKGVMLSHANVVAGIPLCLITWESLSTNVS